MSSQPVIHVWSRRIGLIVIGLLAGSAVPAMWTGEAVAFAIMLGIASLVVGVFTYRLPTEPADPIPTVTTRKIKPVQAALTEADLMLQQTQQTVREIIADAKQRAVEIEDAAELQAREIIDRARTAAAALDPASEHQPRVEPEKA
jgi:hypothetical protein